MSKIGSVGAGGVAGIGGVNDIDFQSGDIEMLLVAVQMRRASLVENEIRKQIEGVHARNEALDRIGTVKADLNTQKTYFNGKSQGTALIDQEHYDSSAWSKKQFQDAYKADRETALTRAKNNEFGPQAKELAELAQSMRDAGVSDETVFKVATGEITASELDAAIGTVTAKGDSLSATQNLDMIRLQSLNSKRNEAFDVVTNTIKKTGDVRSGIVSNMR
jgi:hypothetical protein